MGRRPRSERKLSTFGELKEIPSLDDKIKVGERQGGRGSRGPSCAGAFSYMEELGLDPKGNRDPLESIWQESDVTKALHFGKLILASGWRMHAGGGG